MAKALLIHRTGGPEVLIWEDIAVGKPGPGEVRLQQTALGLNFLDIYHRAGTHHMPLDPLPAIPGVEGAGVVDAVGEGVDELAPGDRVAYAITVGAYAEARLIPAAYLVKLPDDISDETAAAIMLKGLTASHLLRDIAKVSAGHTVLIHAAAGGVGLIACQWAKHLGAKVIGTVGSDAKAELVLRNGCDEAIIYTRENFVDRVNEITGGAGVDAVLDSVGKDTFLGSLACARPGASVASFGLASGPLPPFGFADMPLQVSICRASVRSVTDNRASLLESARALFHAVSEGHVKPVISKTYALRDAGDAHTEMEARRTTGSVVLFPN
ncbi:MAG: quinone oxidoreductase [Proteobacteria bacterium]|nr:quinone oxidoreductase [Pseudomonadota bacterium]